MTTHRDDITAEQNQPRTRRRINVSVSVRGVKTWDCTVDSDELLLPAIIAESDQMVALLSARYPEGEK